MKKLFLSLLSGLLVCSPLTSMAGTLANHNTADHVVRMPATHLWVTSQCQTYLTIPPEGQVSPLVQSLCPQCTQDSSQTVTHIPGFSSPLPTGQTYSWEGSTDVVTSAPLHKLPSYAKPKVFLIGEAHAGERQLDSVKTALAVIQQNKIDAVLVEQPDKYVYHWDRFQTLAKTPLKTLSAIQTLLFDEVENYEAQRVAINRMYAQFWERNGRKVRRYTQQFEKELEAQPTQIALVDNTVDNTVDNASSLSNNSAEPSDDTEEGFALLSLPTNTPVTTTKTVQEIDRINAEYRELREAQTDRSYDAAISTFDNGDYLFLSLHLQGLPVPFFSVDSEELWLEHMAIIQKEGTDPWNESFQRIMTRRDQGMANKTQSIVQANGYHAVMILAGALHLDNLETFLTDRGFIVESYPDFKSWKNQTRQNKKRVQAQQSTSQAALNNPGRTVADADNLFTELTQTVQQKKLGRLKQTYVPTVGLPSKTLNAVKTILNREQLTLGMSTAQKRSLLNDFTIQYAQNNIQNKPWVLSLTSPNGKTLLLAEGYTLGQVLYTIGEPLQTESDVTNTDGSVPLSNPVIFQLPVLGLLTETGSTPTEAGPLTQRREYPLVLHVAGIARAAKILSEQALMTSSNVSLSELNAFMANAVAQPCRLSRGATLRQTQSSTPKVPSPEAIQPGTTTPAETENLPANVQFSL